VLGAGLAAEAEVGAREVAQPAVARAVDEHPGAVAEDLIAQRVHGSDGGDGLLVAHLGGEDVAVEEHGEIRLLRGDDAEGLAHLGVAEAGLHAAHLLDDAALAGVGLRAAGAVDAHAELDAGVAAEDGAVLDERRPRAEPCRGDGRRATRRAGTDHDDVEGAAVLRLERHAGQAAAFLRDVLGLVGRRVLQVDRQDDGVAAAVVARQIVQGDRRLALLEAEVASRRPVPAVVMRLAEDLLGRHAAYDDLELPWRVLGRPVARADPDPPRRRPRDPHLNLGIGDGLAHPRRDEIGRAHQVHELGVEQPAAVVGEVLGVDPQVAVLCHGDLPRGLAEGADGVADLLGLDGHALLGLEALAASHDGRLDLDGRQGAGVEPHLVEHAGQGAAADRRADVDAHRGGLDGLVVR